MIFLECIGSRASLSARTAEGEDSVWFHFAEQVGKKDSPVERLCFTGFFIAKIR